MKNHMYGFNCNLITTNEISIFVYVYPPCLFLLLYKNVEVTSELDEGRAWKSFELYVRKSLGLP